MIEKILAPYKFSQKTNYSKMIIIEIESGRNLAEVNKELAENLLKLYSKQTEAPDKYFTRNKESITGVKDIVCDEDIDFLFVPYGVTKIDYKAFMGADIVGINLPKSLESISELAFNDCVNLQYLHIPDSVKKIGKNAFDGCTNLVSVRLPRGLKKISSKTFYDCCSLEKVDIPDTVEEIGEYAFSSCNFSSVLLPENLNVIKERAFENCENLADILFSPNLRKIMDFAFIGCTSLKRITLPDTIINLGYAAFKNCENLERIKLPEKLTSIDGETFANCTSLKEVELPDSIGMLNEYAFRNTRKLYEINIPKSLDCISAHPFGESSVNTLIFNHDLNSLEVFPDDETPCDLLGDSNIFKLIIKNNVKTITPDAFKYFGTQISSIEYLGTEKEFVNFRNNNKKLFDVLPNIDEITFVSEQIENDFMIDMEER